MWLGQIACLAAKNFPIVCAAGVTLPLEGAGLEGGRCWRGQRRLESRVGVHSAGPEEERNPSFDHALMRDVRGKRWPRESNGIYTAHFMQI